MISKNPSFCRTLLPVTVCRGAPDVAMCLCTHHYAARLPTKERAPYPFKRKGLNLKETELRSLLNHCCYQNTTSRTLSRTGRCRLLRGYNFYDLI